MKTSTKVIIWTGVIVVIGTAGYLAYKQYQKNKEAEEKAAKKNQTIKDIATGIGGLIGGLFGKKDTTPQLTKEQQAVLQYSTMNPLGRF